MGTYEKPIKVRVSGLTRGIIRLDAVNWGITDSAGNANMSGFINKLLPIMYRRKLKRREELSDKIGAIIGDVDEKIKTRLFSAVNAVTDHTYFSDYITTILECDIYVRPNAHSAGTFTSILDGDISVAATTPTEYIRDLLNEYIKMSEYARKSVFFEDELDIIRYNKEERIVTAAFNGKPIRFVPINYMYVYGMNQELYVILYDINCNILRSIPLHELSSLMVGRRYKLQKNILSAATEYMDSRDFIENETREIPPAE